MERLGIFLHASLSCIVVFTFFSGTASENIVNEILQRLEKVEKLNFDLKKQYVELKLETTDLKSENLQLKYTVNEMKVWMKSGKFQVNNNIVESNSDFEKENLKIKLEMDELREQMDNIRRVNSELKETVNEVNGWMKFKQFPEIKKSKSEIHIKEEHLPRIPYNQANESRKDNSIRSVKRLIPPAPDVTEQPVAFYAYMNSYLAASLPLHMTLVFDTVQINDGNGYNKHDGVFIAPRTGVYAFHWSIKIDGHSWASVEIVVNGTPIGCAATDSQRVGDWHTGSELVVTHVNTGDHVFLRTQENVAGYLFSNNRARTSFSGWLLYA